MTTTYKFISATQIIPEPRILKQDDGGRIFGFDQASDAIKLQYGYKPLSIAVQPTPREGYHLEPRYSDGESTITQMWIEVQNPPVPEPAPRTLSRLSIKRFLSGLTRTVDGAEVTAWGEFKSALQALDAYEDFLLSVNLREDDPAFALLQPQLAALLTAYGTDYATLAQVCIYQPDMVM